MCVFVIGDYFHLLMSVLLLMSCPRPSVVLFSGLFHPSLPQTAPVGAGLGCSTGLSGCAQTQGSQMDTSASGWAARGQRQAEGSSIFSTLSKGRGLQIKAVSCSSSLVREGISYPLGHYQV